MWGGFSDPRVVEAFALLREVIAEGGGEGGASVPGAAFGGRGSGDGGGLAGAEHLGSDLLALWQPEAMADEPWSAAWQRYVERTAPAPAAAAAPAGAPWTAPAGFEAGEGLEPFEQALPSRAARAADELRPEEALAVADCLYDFVHALERFDPEAAMACVAEGYHELSGDRGLDRRGFRLWLEELLDGLRGGALEVSLAEVPRPLRFGRLALCPATLQIDVEAPPPAVPSSRVFRWLPAFEREADGRWRLVTAGRLDDSGPPR